ncbi:MAG TPA: PilZ domain-containing protein [Nitrospira sp.]|nr:PilZ domain-containing protein [Nitrospira sp.]
MRRHYAKHLLTETLALAALVLPLALALAAMTGLASWAFRGLEIGLHASWITWCAAIAFLPIALRLFCGPDTRVICSDCPAGPAKVPAGQTTTTKMTALPRQQRRHVRHPVRLPATFANGRGSGYAIIENVSEGGCKITTRLPVAQGDSGRLLINLPGSHAPLTVSTALVRWVIGETCGIEFIGVYPHDRELLHQVGRRVGAGQFGMAGTVVN